MADATPTALLVGASRGLGLGLARELAGRGWDVVATARDPAAPGLAEAAASDRIAVETVDIDHADQVKALHGRLAGRRFDLVFLVAGISHDKRAPAHAVPRETALRVLETNALSPVAAAETLAPLLAARGTMAFMTSGLGSVTNNTTGGWEVYRASKAALNTLVRSWALRHTALCVLLMHPGWVRTDMGGEDAPLDVETSARGMADVIERERGKSGHAYLDYQGKPIAW